MKYVLIFVAVIVLVRIDVVVNLLEKAYDEIPRKIEVVDSRDIKSDREVIPFSEDESLKQDPKNRILSLLESFKLSPYSEIRLKIMEELKTHPSAFGKTLDKTLESHLLGWRDALSRADTETLLFLVDLHGFFQGENLDLVKRVFSFELDFNLASFLKYYSQTTDTMCNPVLLFGDNLPAEEKVNEYYERDSALTAYLLSEKLEPAQKTLATTCQLVLKSELAKLNPEPNPASGPEVINEDLPITPSTGTP